MFMYCFLRKTFINYIIYCSIHQSKNIKMHLALISILNQSYKTSKSICEAILELMNRLKIQMGTERKWHNPLLFLSDRIIPPCNLPVFQLITRYVLWMLWIKHCKLLGKTISENWHENDEIHVIFDVRMKALCDLVDSTLIILLIFLFY